MDRTPAPCLSCGTAVPDDATACPECGYAVDSHDRWRFLMGGLGTLMSLSLVFAPVGLPLLWRAHRHRLAAEGTVTRRPELGVRDHLEAVLRQHFDCTG